MSLLTMQKVMHFFSSLKGNEAFLAHAVSDLEVASLHSLSYNLQIAVVRDRNPMLVRDRNFEAAAEGHVVVSQLCVFVCVW